MDALPDLSIPLAYEHDEGEHPGGGYCADLAGADDLARWTEILLQQHAAFNNLAGKALSSLTDSGTGYEVTRPLLFMAHHVCEVAIKVGLVAALQDQALAPPLRPNLSGRLLQRIIVFRRGSADGPDPNIRGHDLSRLWRRLVKVGGAGDLTTDQVAWCRQFTRGMTRITKQGFEGRYADERRTEQAWCCLHLEQLEACVTAFVRLVLIATARRISAGESHERPTRASVAVEAAHFGHDRSTTGGRHWLTVGGRCVARPRGPQSSPKLEERDARSRAGADDRTNGRAPERCTKDRILRRPRTVVERRRVHGFTSVRA